MVIAGSFRVVVIVFILSSLLTTVLKLLLCMNLLLGWAGINRRELQVEAYLMSNMWHLVLLSFIYHFPAVVCSATYNGIQCFAVC